MRGDRPRLTALLPIASSTREQVGCGEIRFLRKECQVVALELVTPALVEAMSVSKTHR
jgi:hypothetical protein